MKSTLTLDSITADVGSGTKAEFTELYRAHQKMVRSVLFQVSGETQLDDMVQEAFIRIWKYYPKFRGDSKVTSWIYRICVNVAIDSKRSQTRRKENFEFDFQTLEDSRPAPDDDYGHRDLVAKALATLSDEHRTVLVLALMQELPLSEIAEILEVAEGTVKSRLHYAKAEFRKVLASKGVEL